MKRDLPRHLLRGRHREGGGVEYHQALDLRVVRQRPAEADHAAPVVHGQGHRAGDAQVGEQRVQVIHARLQGVVVVRIIGLVRQAHADMVRHDAAVLVREAGHQGAPVIAPRRVAVDHHHYLAIARAFVEIAHRQTGAHLEAVRMGGVTGQLGHSIAPVKRAGRTGP